MAGQRWWRRRALVVATLLAALGSVVDATPARADEYDSNGNTPWMPMGCGMFAHEEGAGLWQVPKYMSEGTVGFWMSSYDLDSEKLAIFGSGWYLPSPTTQTISGLEWTWNDAYILFYCSTRTILWGRWTQYQWLASSTIEGDATVNHNWENSSGASEDERNDYEIEGGSLTCWEIWYVWPDGYEEYSGDDICYEEDET